MRFRLGLILGIGIGYVLGTRAGRERYEQIREGWSRFSGSPTVRRAAGRTKDMAGEQGKRALQVVQQGVEKAGAAVKDRLRQDEPPPHGQQSGL